MDTRQWSKCFLCQDDADGEKLIVPSKAVTMTDAKLKDCFTEQVKFLLEIERLGGIPDGVNVSDMLPLGRQKIVEEMMLHKNDLRWHKSCRTLVNNKKVERLSNNQKRKIESESNYSPVKKTRSFTSPDSTKSSSSRHMRSSDPPSTEEYTPKCFICDKDDGGRLWKASTFGLNSRVHYCAKVTKNESLQRKLFDGDLIAIEAEYHVACLSKLYREAAAHDRGTKGDTNMETIKRELVFRELIDYLEGFRGTLTRIPMGTISKMYQNELSSHGLDGIVHTTRLRGIILSAIPDITQVQHQNGTWDLVFDEDLSEKVNEMNKMDSECSASYFFVKIY